jgi:hypothetical protein
MDQYNALMDKIGDAIIAWSDPSGKWRADREVSMFLRYLQLIKAG